MTIVQIPHPLCVGFTFLTPERLRLSHSPPREGIGVKCPIYDTRAQRVTTHKGLDMLPVLTPQRHVQCIHTQENVAGTCFHAYKRACVPSSSKRLVYFLCVCIHVANCLCFCHWLRLFYYSFQKKTRTLLTSTVITKFVFPYRQSSKRTSQETAQLN